MKVLVQKFGGTSVATAESRQRVYDKIEEAQKLGYGMVVVISAMGRKGDPYATDTLLDLIRIDCPEARQRELDHIFVCGEIISGAIVTANLHKKGHLATYLTGGQAGIITTEHHGDAEILRIETNKIRDLLSQGHIVVVAGGQGATNSGEVTTLGRGGSDTTACALGVALNAERIEIYTDVEGIMTSDPRVITNAKLLKEISYTCCCEIAYQGAKVMHPRAVEIASQKPSIALYVRSTFSDFPGTLICSDNHHLPDGADLPRGGIPIGVAALDKQVMFRVENLPTIEKANILKKVHHIDKNAYDIHPETQGLLLISEERSAAKISNLLDTLNSNSKRMDELVKVSLIGKNLLTFGQFSASFLAVLEGESIPVIAMTAKNNVISGWVRKENATDAMKAVHGLLEEKDKKDNYMPEDVAGTA